jgi:hypothetical protein
MTCAAAYLAAHCGNVPMLSRKEKPTMYDRDMPLMRAHALASPDGLVDVIAFVLATIQQPLQSVANQMADIRTHGAKSKYLFGSKRIGLAYAIEHKHVLFAAVRKAAEIGDVIGAVDVLSNVPGLGIVKASFVAQICGMETACLDTHNLKRLGLAETAFKLDKGVKPETKRKKITRYVGLCSETGGSRHWWDIWCETVAGNRANRSLTTADAVSAYHVQCIAA